MKTPEEILEEYCGKIIIPFDENITIYYPALINAMQEYAELYHNEKSNPEIDIEAIAKRHLNNWKY